MDELESELSLIAQGRHYDPFRVLGLHPEEDPPVIRVWAPDARQVSVHPASGRTIKLKPRVGGPAGFFEARVPAKTTADYQLETEFQDGNRLLRHDPYSFLPVLGDVDLHLFAQGDHHQIYRKLGAHLLTHGGVAGVHFAVWAPNAERVSVVGNFNGWNGLRHPLRSLGSSGIWELFLPDLGAGEYYKFELRDRSGSVHLKSDPYGFQMQLRPDTASVVCALEGFAWTDQDWCSQRESDQRKQPISIYELHLGSWRHRDGRPMGYRDLAEPLVEYVRELGFSHVEFMPLLEHPLDDSWGYQVSGYFAATARYGTPQDLMQLIDRLHAADIGVLMDWVPGHFPTDPSGLGRFDGTPLYEYADPRKGFHQDWNTWIFDYGRREVVNFLLASALFWLEVYHLDGLRVDAVASMLYLDFSRKAGEWIPNQYGGNENLEAIEFLRRLNSLTHRYHPGVLIMAEESSSFSGVTRPVYAGGLGFDFKWGMGWMNDSLAYFAKEPVYRKYEHHKISFFMVYAYSENYVLPISHDEVVHLKGSLLDKMPGDVWQKFANLRAFLGYMWTMPGKKLLFMGSEFGQWQEWNFAQSLDWHLLEFPSHRGISYLVADLNRLYRQEPALHRGDCLAGGFDWLVVDDSDNSIFAYLRRDPLEGSEAVVICNFTPVQRNDYRIGIPRAGRYREIFNSDAERYWGGNQGNLGEVLSEPLPWGAHPHSLRLLLPALSILILKPEPAG